MSGCIVRGHSGARRGPSLVVYARGCVKNPKTPPQTPQLQRSLGALPSRRLPQSRSGPTPREHRGPAPAKPVASAPKPPSMNDAVTARACPQKKTVIPTIDPGLPPTNMLDLSALLLDHAPLSKSGRRGPYRTSNTCQITIQPAIVRGPVIKSPRSVESKGFLAARRRGDARTTKVWRAVLGSSSASHSQGVILLKS